MNLRIHGELSAVSGSAITRFEAAGSSLTWHLGQEPKALAALPPLKRRARKRLAQYLVSTGLTLDVRYRNRSVISIGAGPTSLLGKLLIGSEHARLGPARAWAPALLIRLRR